jgi:hypothetical protein
LKPRDPPANLITSQTSQFLDFGVVRVPPAVCVKSYRFVLPGKFGIHLEQLEKDETKEYYVALGDARQPAIDSIEKRTLQSCPEDIPGLRAHVVAFLELS